MSPSASPETIASFFERAHDSMNTIRRVNLASYSKGDYYPGPLGKRILWLLTSRCFFETSIPWPSSMKVVILRCFGAEVGKAVVLKPRLQIKYPWFLKIGNHTWIGEHSWLDNIAPIEIGNHVVISQAATLMTGNHDYSSESFDLMAKPITVEDGCWIASKAVVCPGITAGESSVLLVASVAISDLEPSEVYAGNPAVRIRSRLIVKSSSN